MNGLQRGVLTLLKNAISEDVRPLPEDFDWEAAYRICEQHNLLPAMYSGILACGANPGEALMQKLFQRYCRAVQICARQTREIKRICDAFENGDIDYMPLKGCNMRPRYPKPELRLMGDADILIRLEQYEKIIPIMESLGFDRKQESDHELIWESPSLFLELHKRVIPSYNDDYFAYYGDGWHLASLRDGCRYAMNPEDELIYLITHFAKHYRDGGIGCRHVMDLWIYMGCFPSIDTKYLEQELEKLQLLTFWRNVKKLLQVWFEDGVSDDVTDLMTDYLFDSGSFGSEESRLISGELRYGKRTITALSGRFLYIFRALFRPVSMLKKEYPVLEKALWLLPLVWLIRPFRKVFVERTSLGFHKRNLQTIHHANITQRQQMLHQVGLDFNF